MNKEKHKCKYRKLNSKVHKYTEWHRKKEDHHAVCEHNLRKLLLHNGRM